jgi:murein DD-endopeptidase MepM/ murein hydrolase activator NlpD
VIADRPPNTPVDQLPTVKTPSKNSVSGCPEQQLKTDRNAAKICMPPSIIEPGSDDRMKLYSSYNCGLPRNIQNDEEARYDLLANGQVLLPELLIPDSDTLKLGMGKKPANTVVKKSHKNTVAKKKSKVRIAAREQTQFLKAPLAYRRVSSGFSYNRLNPITNVEQPHLGIDYSAPSGTPVHSIGPGKVLFYGWDGGYGKIIRILHNNGYISQYAHLCRFARGIMTGKRIRRGETVGYVGMTGLATGPHLDFRVTHRGIFINPMKVEGSSWKISSKYETGKVHKAARG